VVATRRRDLGKSVRAAGSRLGRGIGQAGPCGEQLSRRPRLRIREHLDGRYARACVYLEIERIRTRVGGSDELTAIAIRATTVFRREDGTWKVTHRHGDPITSMRPAQSVLQS
jgi:SnoaL-like domain